MTGIRSRACLGALLILACDAPMDAPIDPSDLEQAPRIDVIEELRIGSVDDPDDGFTRILGIAGSDDGRIYVYDGGAVEIRVFDGEGRRVGTVGRRGEGPGEFSGTPRFGIQGDTLWTIDRTLSRITLFDLDGGVVSAERYEPLTIQVRTGFASVAPWVMGPGGLFLSWPSSVRSGSSEEGHTETRVAVPMPAVRFAADGSVVDTVGWLPTPPPRLVPPPGSGSMNIVQLDGIGYIVPSPPSALPYWVGIGDGRVETHIPPPESERGTMTLTRLAVAGDTVFHRELHYRAEPFTSTDLDAIAESGVERSPRAPADREARRRAAERIRSAMEFPTHSPTVGLPRVLADGSAWIPRLAAGGGATARWVVLGSDGSLLGQVEFAAPTTPFWFDGEHAWVVEYDDLDVPWLVRYRLEP